MGYGKDDELAINTIRLLAVGSHRRPLVVRLRLHCQKLPREGLCGQANG